MPGAHSIHKRPLRNTQYFWVYLTFLPPAAACLYTVLCLSETSKCRQTRESSMLWHTLLCGNFNIVFIYHGLTNRRCQVAMGTRRFVFVPGLLPELSPPSTYSEFRLPICRPGIGIAGATRLRGGRRVDTRPLSSPPSCWHHVWHHFRVPIDSFLNAHCITLNGAQGRNAGSFRPWMSHKREPVTKK